MLCCDWAPLPRDEAEWDSLVVLLLLLLVGRLIPGTLAVDSGTETYRLGALLLLPVVGC